MDIFSNLDKKIRIIDEKSWFKHCAPAGGNEHWESKRSAKEMALFWLNKAKQDMFLKYLSKFLPINLKFEFAIPEYPTKFDEFKNPRKNDLYIKGISGDKEILILIEGKADEPYGNYYFKDEWITSVIQKSSNKNSKKLDRIINLYHRCNGEAQILDIRYQLIFWLAGAIEEAKRRGVADIILISQEFHSDKTKVNNIQRNTSDLNTFVSFLSKNTIKDIKDNRIEGPINNDLTDNKNVYIGKYISGSK